METNSQNEILRIELLINFRIFKLEMEIKSDEILRSATCEKYDHLNAMREGCARAPV